MADATDKITNATRSDVCMHLDELLKGVTSKQDEQISSGNSLIYKAKIAKMNLILFLSKKQNNFNKLACYVDYMGYKAYEERDDWGRVTAKRGIPRNYDDAKEKAFMAAKVINNALRRGFLTENDINDSSFKYVLHRIQYIEPKLADWSKAVANLPKENKDNSARNKVNSTSEASKTSQRTIKENEGK